MIHRVSIFVLSLSWGIFFYFLINTEMADKLDSMGAIGLLPFLLPIGTAVLSILYRLKLFKGEVDSDERNTIIFLWVFGGFLVIPGLILPFRKPPKDKKQSLKEKKEVIARKSKRKNENQIVTNVKIQALIKEKELRPLGNKERLTHTDDPYNVRLFLFADKQDSDTYYKEFITYAEKKPPPFCIEIMQAKIHTIWKEPFGLVFPYERTDTRPEYVAWFREATLACNEVLRNFQPTDHSYQMLNRYIKEFYDWTILVPADFDIDSHPFKEIFSDPENGGYPFGAVV
ncbi:MAG: hypothetical protein JXI33_01955 [Candidatus Aminicenantes bacterium]|nr:hypothetical protein [Candidatus Aminicenantes bacterium]